MRWYKTTATICLIVSLIGIVHAMSHHTFHRLFLRLLNDLEALVKSIVDYSSITFVKLNFGKTNKFMEVIEHYDVLTNNVRPLADLLEANLRDLIHFFNNLEIVRHAWKFIYAYFRQSAINIIDHLKRVYELY